MKKSSRKCSNFRLPRRKTKPILRLRREYAPTQRLKKDIKESIKVRLYPQRKETSRLIAKIKSEEKSSPISRMLAQSYRTVPKSDFLTTV